MKMTAVHRDLSEYDALLERVHDMDDRLERADFDRLRLVNERAKLLRRCEDLSSQVKALQIAIENLQAAADKLEEERDQLRAQLERANQAKKVLAVEVQKKN